MMHRNENELDVNANETIMSLNFTLTLYRGLARRWMMQDLCRCLLRVPRQTVVISRASGNKIGMGLSNQTTFCG